MKTSHLAAALAFYAVCTLISMATMSIGAATLMAAFLLAAWRGRDSGGRIAGPILDVVGTASGKRYAKSAALFFVTAVISLVCAAIWPLTYGGQGAPVRWLNDLAKAWYLAWPIVIAAAFSLAGEKARAHAVRAWLLAFGALSLLGVAQFFVGWPRPHMIPGFEPRYHAVLFLGHHLTVASVLIFPFFVCLDLAARPAAQPPKSPFAALLPRKALIAFAALGALTLLATFSRMLWLALPVGLLVWGLWTAPRRWKIPAALAVVAAAAVAAMNPAVQSRMTYSLGVGTRQMLWEMSLTFSRARPITGIGWQHNVEMAHRFREAHAMSPDTFIGHAHNNVLEILAGTGALGLTAWLVLSLSAFVVLWRPARDGVPMARGLFCAWLVLQLNGLTQVNFWESKVLHQQAWAWGLALSLAAGSREKRAKG